MTGDNITFQHQETEVLFEGTLIYSHRSSVNLFSANKKGGV